MSIEAMKAARDWIGKQDSKDEDGIHAYVLLSDALKAAQPQGEPVITDAMALSFHRSMSDGDLGRADMEEIKKALRAAFAAQPTPFPDCKYATCDLPGQCKAEGKCHHPKAAQPQEYPSSADDEATRWRHGEPTQPERVSVPVSDERKLWLWKNFVDGRPEYWAFDNPYPIHLHSDDPQTLGEPCGYAIFKESRTGRTDVSEAEVLSRIKKAAAPVSNERVSVPREPTQAMTDAAREASDRYPFKPEATGDRLSYLQVTVIYRAMLAAAQEGK